MYFSNKNFKSVLVNAETGAIKPSINKEEAIKIAAANFEGEPNLKSAEYITTVGSHNEYIGVQISQCRQYLWSVHSLRLKHGYVVSDGQFFDGIHMLMMSSSGPLRLSQHADHGLRRFQQRAKWGDGEFARTHQNKF